ncbi:MAG TPA: tetratricopeptide repeat protein [Fimbriiglobus sp.]|nr:tetratricopeptide repeat protein [Fimbriiglobus sp.]
MTSVQREYILKGIFLGLWAYLALLLPGWDSFGRVVAWTAGGLVLGLIAGAVLQFMRGYKPQANPGGFLLLTLLDSSFVIYIGVVGGLAVGVLTERPPPDPAAAYPVRDWIGYFAIGGAVLGYGFHQLTQVRQWVWRFGLGVGVGAAAVYLAVHYIQVGLGLPPADQERFAAFLLIGLPFFYVLTFCGEADESEVEIAALCAALGVGLYLLGLPSGISAFGGKLILLVPLLVYFHYATRALPHLRVFKHVLRGYGNLHLGKVRPALVSFGRALQLNPRSPLAAQGVWALHRRVDVTKLDEQTVGLLNFDFCLDIAQGLVIRERAPTESERAEAARMLDLVEQQKPDLLPRVDYLRAVSLTHAKQFDDAASHLARLLDPETPYNSVTRKAVLFLAWDLALRLHPELVRRLGGRELEKPGRRVEAIAAVERQLAKQPDDPAALELKRELYAGLTEPEFVAAAATEAPADFNYDYVEQLGLALVDDPAQIERGMAYLRIAGRGLPGRGPVIFTTLADLAAKRGDAEAARGYLEQVKRSGQLVGPKSLPADQRGLYVAALKKLADDAAARGDFRSAVEDMRLYVEAGKEDANTLRVLAELYVKNNDALNGLLIVERGLLYAKTDPDLLAKKDSYYYSVDPDRLAAVRDKVAGWFDVAYCVTKAQAVANQKDVDADTLDYGLHLARLARVVQPEGHAAQLAEARLRLRKGERDEALRMLEDIREAKRGSGEEEDAWFVANRVLGLLYLDELNRPDLAINCFTDYREYQRSGADTLYDLGRAYEAKGDRPAAVKSYELVTAYQNHPRYWDATEAVRRLKEDG